MEKLPRLSPLASLAALLTLTAAAAPASAQELPEGFEAVPVWTGIKRPVGLHFLEDGSALAFTIEGYVHFFDGVDEQPDPVIDLSDEVNYSGDRGLLGMTLHPDYVPDGGPTSWMYMLYLVSPVFGVDTDWNENDQFSFSRLTRFRTTMTEAGLFADLASREVLLGNQLPDGSVPDGICHLHASHSNGTLVFGADGSLLMATGDGAHFDFFDYGGNDAPGFDNWVHPETGLKGPSPIVQDSGSFRSRDPRSMSGKILRLDPETGAGYPSNPWYNGDPFSNESRTWATGLRNPYRTSLLPGTGSTDPTLGDPGTLLIGDVGASAWEEVNLCTGGEDFGWPCRQGVLDMGDFLAQDPADPEFPDCGKDIGGVLTDPWVAWTHSNPAGALPFDLYQDEEGNPLEGYLGTCATGGEVYLGGGYPDAYDGRYFFMDLLGWINTVEFDGSGNVVAVRPFASNFLMPVALHRHPITGDLYLVQYLGADSVLKLRYVDPDGIEVYGCANPAGSLTLLQDGVHAGETARLRIDNPLGTQSPPCLTALAVSSGPDAAFPCGTSIPGYGMAGFGASGELLLDVSPGATFTAVGGTPWDGSPVDIAVPVPLLYSLVGQEAFAQALIFDPDAPGAGSDAQFALTEGLRFVIGS